MIVLPALRISFGLAALTVSLLLLGQLIGLAPDKTKAILESRIAISQSLATQFSVAVENGEIDGIKKALETLVADDNEIDSAAIRRSTGRLLLVAGNHLANWSPPEGGGSTINQVQVPVYSNGKRWATVEIIFASLGLPRSISALKNSYIGLILFVGFSGFCGYFLFMKRTLRELDPTSVIPGRVKAAFDILKEGVLILDEKEQIVMVNTSFAETIGFSTTALVGKRGSELDWQGFSQKMKLEKLPWLKVLKDNESITGSRLVIGGKASEQIIFVVNAMPILDGKGRQRGVLATFDNITELEEKNEELSKTLGSLQVATEKVKVKNRELEFLATHDPLTGLLNRRSMEEQFRNTFIMAQGRDAFLSCIMCDIDFFKSINDNHGHAVGDLVIKKVAAILKENSRELDLVGRYGGEEFCIVLPGLDLLKAANVAERMRIAVEQESVSGVSVTMSFGVSMRTNETEGPEELTNEADKVLYTAKETGRNRVVCKDGEGVV